MTKKILLTLAIVLASVAGASAQFRYGPVVGVDLTSLHFKQDLFEVNQAPGATAGVMAEMIFPGIGFGIDFGLNYQTRGAKLHLDQREMWASQGYASPRLWLHYLEIPLHLRFKWTRMNGLEDTFAPFVFGGPSFGFLLGHSKLPAMEYAGGDVGLTAGIGIELFRHWQIMASYTWGVTYALKAAVLTNMSAQNRTWDLRVCYLF